MTQARAIWSIALPAMATNVATALLGVADIWVIGQLGDAASQGAVEVGARLLMALLIVFNFLRTATTGLTAQSAGSGGSDASSVLLRALAFALVIGLALLAVKPLAVDLGLDLLAAKGEIRGHAAAYVGIRYWAAPFWLINAVLAGWLFGLRRVRAVLAVEIATNLAHVGLDVLLVLGLGKGIEGVAVATFTSETLKFVLLVVAIRPSIDIAGLRTAARAAATWQVDALAALFRVNRDLFLRTLLLMLAFTLLTRAGAEQGATILAANAILLQFFMLSALILDAFENAAQVLCGEAVGARDRPRFDSLTRAILLRGGGVALVIAAFYALAGGAIIASFSNDPGVVATASDYAGWAILLPVAGVVSYVFDGVFIGATWTRAMLLTMAAAIAAYIGLLVIAAPLGNHGLWLAFTMFLACRAAAQAAYLPSLARRTFAPIVAASEG